mgnify:FL=1
MILVLADDITGAAEIAGVALSYGRRTFLSMGHIPQDTNNADVIVIATDIRSGDKENAAFVIKRLCRDLKTIVSENKTGLTIFKKTDSVLRGHIGTELHIMMKHLGYRCSLLIAQNPSKGRIIRNGVYYIGDTPLSDTFFNKDPEFPAHTSSATELVGKECSKSLGVNQDLEKTPGIIYIADATSIAEIKKQAEKMTNDILAAGGADFFKNLLNMSTTLSGYMIKSNNIVDKCRLNELKSPSSKILVLCGSTQSKSIADTKIMHNKNTIVKDIPDDIFEGASPEIWTDLLCEEYYKSNAFIIQVGNHELKGAEYARRLRRVMACATKKLVEKAIPDYLIIEGGATAFAALSSISWESFIVSHEYAPGVVGMIHGKAEIILKPGSYSWGDLFN